MVCGGIAVGVGLFSGVGTVPSAVVCLGAFFGMGAAAWGVPTIVIGFVDGNQPYSGLLDALIEECAREQDKELLNALNEIKGMPTEVGKSIFEKGVQVYELTKSIKASAEKIKEEVQKAKEKANTPKNEPKSKNELKSQEGNTTPKDDPPSDEGDGNSTNSGSVEVDEHYYDVPPF